MSRLMILDGLRQFEKSLVNGYFITNYNNEVPMDIIKLCTMFCFILDEFNETIPSNCEEINMEGLNNTIVNVQFDNVEHTIMQKQKKIVIARNLIKPNTGKYHWKLNILNMSNTGNGIKIGFINKQNATFSCKMRHYYSVKYSTWKRNAKLYHLYFDSDTMKTNIISEKYKHSPITDTANDKMHYQLAIQFRADTMIELIEYNASNWYSYNINNEMDSNENGLMQIGLANCEFDKNIKLKYYENALKINPNIELWNDLYLQNLNALQKYDCGYNYAIKYKKGMNGIAELAESFIAQKQIEKGFELLSLLSDSQLILTKSNLRYGYCLKQKTENKKSDPKNAAKYMEIHLLQLEKNTENESKQENDRNIINTLRHLAWAYYHAHDFENGLRIFKRMKHSEIERYNLEGAIAHCYEHSDVIESIKYYKLYQDKYPTNPWSYQRMVGLYADKNDNKSKKEQKEWLMKYMEISKGNTSAAHAFQCYAQYVQNKEEDYDTAKEFYFKALDAAQDDRTKRDIYCSVSITFHLLENWEEAVKYGLKALKYKPNSSTYISNVAEYYFHAKQYENSYKYFKMAMKINPLSPLTNGYFAMTLYEWKRYDESMLYFEKYFEFQHQVGGHCNAGMKSRCFNVYGNILFSRENYEMSLDICIQAMEDEDFKFYKKQDQIYYLLSRNYLKNQDFETALKYLQKAKEINPNRKVYDNQIQILITTMQPDFDST